MQNTGFFNYKVVGNFDYMNDINNDIVESIIVLDELKEFISPLSKEEFNQLKENLISEGCREPLMVWERSEQDYILVDGHNRYKVCQEFDISFKVQPLKFDNVEEAKFWMINNQLGRRNLNPDQMSYFRGLKYESLKKKRGGYEFVESVGQNEPATYTKLALEFNVSESTIKRDAKFARGLSFIGKSNPKLKGKILNGEIKIKKSDIILFSDIDEKDIKSIKNEADLHNKASQIRNRILTDIEKKLKESKEDKIKRAQEELKSRDVLFVNQKERVNRVKGAIISAINRAIHDKDIKAMNELKVLIEKLEDLLFGD